MAPLVLAGTVTVLFADVEGSTALLERLGHTRWLDGLAEYEALLSASVGTHGGTLVKALGDGHLLAFPSARAALRCAIDVQRALPLDRAPDLRVRMGLHTGEPAVREGDLHGRTVVKAARIADLARGGEILVSSVARELAEADEELGEGVWFEPGRELDLRGLRGRHVVTAARWDPLPRRALRVVIADDSALVRDGVAAVLRECGVHVAAIAGDADSLYREVERHRPDVALVDIRMPPTCTNEGLAAAKHIGSEYPEVGVLVLSQHLEHAYALRLVEDRNPRRGYLLKDRVCEIETLLDAIRRVAHGGTVVDPAIVEQLALRPSAARAPAGSSVHTGPQGPPSPIAGSVSCDRSQSGPVLSFSANTDAPTGKVQPGSRLADADKRFGPVVEPAGLHLGDQEGHPGLAAGTAEHSGAGEPAVG